jgi:hypothetical protein
MNGLNPSLYDDIRRILDAARGKAFSAVNFAMVQAYWQIGKRIVEEEQRGEERAGYGKRLIGELSKKHTAEYRNYFVHRKRRHHRPL